MAMQTRKSRWANIKDALSVIERGRAQAEMAGGASLHPTVFHPNGGRRLWHRYYEDNDINVPAVELGALLARSAIAARGTPISSVHIWGIDRQAYDKFDWEIDFEPFMHVDELLNFFVAVTIQEMNDGLNPVAPYDKAFGPMWRTVCETAQDPKRVGGPKACDPGFSESYWTNLLPHKTRKEIVAGVWARNPQALKDFAVIRLVSAWSYMHMLYNWTYASGQQDIIAMTDKASVTDPFFELKAPVDPRQAFVGGDGRWHNRVGDTSGPRGDWGVDFRPGMTWPYVATVRDVRQTKTQAHGFTLAAAIAKLSGEIGGAFKRGLAAGTNTAVATLVQQFKQPTSTTLTATAQSSNLMQQAIASGKISMFARPDLYAASQAQAASQQQALQQPQAGGSLLPIAAIAGLALLLMR
jgi:hypothetical protein